jgi:hypothetical protein
MFLHGATTFGITTLDLTAKFGTVYHINGLLSVAISQVSLCRVL